MGTRYGPFPRSVVKTLSPNVGSSRIFRKTQNVFKSVPRKSMVLPYSMVLDHAFEFHGPVTSQNGVDAPNELGAYLWDSNDYRIRRMKAQAYQKAYGKFVEKVRSQAQWGPNIAERREAYDMILKRAGTLFSAAQSLRRGDILGMCRQLRVPYRRKWLRERMKRKAKRAHYDLSDVWLEYHFGWEPLVKDIYDFVDILQGKFPVDLITASASSDMVYRSNTYDSSLYERRFVEVSFRVRCRLQGRYSVDNPNLFLANQLGLINPVSVAWELVPFSFVVDWFAPVGQFLGSFTDFYGLNRWDEAVSTKGIGLTDVMTTYHGPYAKLAPEASKTNHLRFTRELGIPTPVPVQKVFKGFSVTRGVTAISLLVGALGSLRGR